jgi:hypothetical protein
VTEVKTVIVGATPHPFDVRENGQQENAHGERKQQRWEPHRRARRISMWTKGTALSDSHRGE